MNYEVFHKAQLLHERIIMVKDIIESIAKDGIKLEYDVSTPHGKVPQRILADDRMKDMVIEYYERELSELQKEMEAL